MRFYPREETRWRALLGLVLICVLGTSVEAQDRFDWQSLAQLKAGDRTRVFLRTGAVEGAFGSWTPNEMTVGTVTARKEDVLKVERYRPGAWGRGKKAGVGALIGFGGGFAVGAAAAGCEPRSIVCVSRSEGGMFLGATGAVIGAGIGALLPSHTKEVIYSVR